MRCLRLTQFRKNGDFLPCGQCMPCRINKRTEWLTRLSLEWWTWYRGAFVTLTYAPEHLPTHGGRFPAGNLDKETLQKFIKRFRFNYQRKFGSSEIRYFAVGEYGDKSNRAHYHLLLFNVDPLAADEIVKKSWKFGFSTTAELHYNRLRYTVGYTIKKMTREEDFSDGRYPEFSIMSKKPPIGSYMVPQWADFCLRNNLIPGFGLTREQKFVLERRYGIKPKYWDGIFYRNEPDTKKQRERRVYYRMDRTMQRKILEYMETDLLDIANEDIDSTLLDPRQWRSYKNRLTDSTYFAKIHFEEDPDYAEKVKQAEKFRRAHKETRTL